MLHTRIFIEKGKEIRAQIPFPIRVKLYVVAYMYVYAAVLQHIILEMN